MDKQDNIIYLNEFNKEIKFETEEPEGLEDPPNFKETLNIILRSLDLSEEE